MNEQEMQFADPDWQPTGSLSAEQREAAKILLPQPSVAANHVEPLKEIDYTQGYRGSDRPYFVPPVSQQYMPPRQLGRRRPRSFWWVWIIAAIIFFSLISNMTRTSFGHFDRGFPGPQGAAQFNKDLGGYQGYGLGDAKQITISDTSGSIIIASDQAPTGQVLVQGDENPQVNNDTQGMTITSSDGSDDLTVEVPQGVALNLQTDAGDISVSNFTGQLSAKTNSGTIVLKNDALAGQNVIDGGSGDITFNGTLDPQGSYQFTTDSGNITLDLPQNTSMQVQHHEGSGGSYHTDFLAKNNNAPAASVTVTTNSGSIEIAGQ